MVQNLVITQVELQASFDIRLAVAVEQASYFETFIEFSEIRFFADNDLSGNFTIGLTPKLLNQEILIKSKVLKQLTLIFLWRHS